MDIYQVAPATVQAVQNQFNTTQTVVGTNGEEHSVPAGWWLVETAAGPVMMSDGAFRASYSPFVTPVGMDNFVSTVGNLLNGDRQLATQFNQIDSRVAALEAMAAAVGAAVSGPAPSAG